MATPSVNCLHPVIGLNPDGKVLICCDCPEPVLDRELWLCAQCYDLSIFDPPKPKDEPITTQLVYIPPAGFPIQNSVAQREYHNGMCVYRPDFAYPGYSQVGTSTNLCLTLFNLQIKAFVVGPVPPQGDPITYRVEIRVLTPNPEGHPGWDFELTFPAALPHTSQVVLLTFPDSPISQLTGAITLSFGTSEEAAKQNCEISCCDEPGNIVMAQIWPAVILGGPKGPVFAWLFHEFTEANTQWDGCGKRFDFQSPIIQRYVPTNDDDGTITLDGWTGEYSHKNGTVSTDNANYNITNCDASNPGWVALQRNTIRGKYYNRGGDQIVWDDTSGNGYNIFTDFEGQDGMFPCGSIYDNKGCFIDFTDNCPTPEPGGAILASFKVMGLGPSYASIEPGPNNGFTVYSPGVGIGAWREGSDGVLYGGVPAGVTLFPGCPIVGLDQSAIEFDPNWQGRVALSAGIGFEFWCSGTGNPFLFAWPSGNMRRGIEDHPLNPDNIYYYLY